MAKFKPTELIVADSETTGLRYWHGDRPFAVSLADQDGGTWYTEWPVNPFTREVQPVDSDVRYLRKLLGGTPKIPKVFHNAKFDVRMLHGVGVEVRGPIEDTGVAARICYTLEPSYALKPLALKYAGVPLDDETALQREVVRCRNVARKRGWNIAENCAQDYWLPRAVDPESTHCEQYAVSDVYPRTLLLWLMYDRVVMADKSTPEFRAMYEFEMRQVWPSIKRMEDRGIRIDKRINREWLERSQLKAEEEKKSLRAMLKRDRKYWFAKHEQCEREPFNPGSPKQLARVLYHPRDGYGLEVRGTSKKTGDPSTDWKALREHLTHPFVFNLVQSRSAEKAVGTYFGNYEELAVPDANGIEDCIHANLNQLGANKTSRTSSNNPNLQNVGDANNNPNSPAPIQAREPFGPRKGYDWYSLDWSGQEIRIYAECADIEELLQAAYSGADIPAAVANRAWGGKGNQHALQAAAYSLELGSNRITKPEVLDLWRQLEWTPEKAKLYGFSSERSFRVCDEWLRRFKYDIVKAESSIGLKRTRTRSKNLLYAKIYGAGIDGVIDMLYCTRSEAREMLRRLDEVFPGMYEFSSEFSRQAKERGYIHNLYGRRLNIDPWYAYRAVNYLVQSSAADMIKRALVKADEYLRRINVDGYPVMAIHDELVFEIKKEHAHTWVLRGIRNIMEGVGSKVLQVPMTVECSRITERWSQKEPICLN